jgi:ABC-2 type transport system permease protein
MTASTLGTIGSLTASNLFGKRRVALLFVLPVLLVLLAVTIRVLVGQDDGVTQTLLQYFALSPIVPLLCLIAGTGVIGPEIDDGSIIYILAKPVPRWAIVVTKFVVAVGCVALFAALPTFIAGLVLSGFDGSIAVGFAAAALVAGVAYSALFLLLAVISRHAVVWGLVYALVWESLVGTYVPGAKSISIQQWALAVADKLIAADTIEPAVGLGAGTLLLLVVTVGSVLLAGRRLRSLTLVEV